MHVLHGYTMLTIENEQLMSSVEKLTLRIINDDLPYEHSTASLGLKLLDYLIQQKIEKHFLKQWTMIHTLYRTE